MCILGEWEGCRGVEILHVRREKKKKNTYSGIDRVYRKKKKKSAHGGTSLE